MVGNLPGVELGQYCIWAFTIARNPIRHTTLVVHKRPQHKVADRISKNSGVIVPRQKIFFFLILADGIHGRQIACIIVTETHNHIVMLSPAILSLLTVSHLFDLFVCFPTNG